MLIFNEQSRILACRIDEYTKQANKAYNLYPRISACTLDIIAGQSYYHLLILKQDFMK